MKKDIEKAKKKLIAQTKRIGCVHENFGQKEVRKLQDKYNYIGLLYGDEQDREEAKLLGAFEAWCWDYTGE